jgi:hypothetical protein
MVHPLVVSAAVLLSRMALALGVVALMVVHERRR